VPLSEWLHEASQLPRRDWKPNSSHCARISESTILTNTKVDRFRSMPRCVSDSLKTVAHTQNIAAIRVLELGTDLLAIAPYNDLSWFAALQLTACDRRQNATSTYQGNVSSIGHTRGVCPGEFLQFETCTCHEVSGLRSQLSMHESWNTRVLAVNLQRLYISSPATLSNQVKATLKSLLSFQTSGSLTSQPA
jgi:hypothetical protein